MKFVKESFDFAEYLFKVVVSIQRVLCGMLVCDLPSPTPCVVSKPDTRLFHNGIRKFIYHVKKGHLQAKS
jgi:hypothetical protein